MESTTVLEKIPFKKTTKGGRMDLRVYVYPGGHGNIDQAFPVNDIEEAVSTFRRLWEAASKAHEGSS